MYVKDEIKTALEALGWVYREYKEACGGGTDDTYLKRVWKDPSGVERNVPPAGMNHRPGWRPTTPELIGLLLVEYKQVTCAPYWDYVFFTLSHDFVSHSTDTQASLIYDLAVAVKTAKGTT